MEEERNGIALTAKIIACIIFSLVMLALASAVVTDIVVFAEQIFAFVGACIMSVIVFIMALILMVLSIMLIFGIFILENSGFWPIQWASEIFRNIIGDHLPSRDQIQLMVVIRVILIIICIIVFILSIACLAMNHSVKRTDPKQRSKLTSAFGVLSLIFSILGLGSGAIAMLLLSII